jgi:hypothetical protein
LLLAPDRPFVCGVISYRSIEESAPKRSIDLRMPEVSASLWVCRAISERNAGSESEEHSDLESEKGSGTIDSGLSAGRTSTMDAHEHSGNRV